MASYSYAKAMEYVKNKIDGLNQGPKAWQNRGIKEAAYKIGIEQVLEQLCCYGSKIHQNFKSTASYRLSDDDIRIVVKNMQAEIVAEQEKHMIPSWF